MFSDSAYIYCTLPRTPETDDVTCATRGEELNYEKLQELWKRSTLDLIRFNFNFNFNFNLLKI